VGWCTTHHQLISARSFGALALAALLCGCTAVPTPVATPTVSLASRLTTALASGADQFTELFASPVLAASWYSALAQPGTQLAGSDATHLQVSTRFSGDRRTGSESLTVEISPEGRIVGTRDEGVRPLWALGGAQVFTTTHGTLLASDMDDAVRDRWATRVNQASAAVSAADLLTGSPAWDGGLVVELPADVAGFVAATGSNASDAAAITTCASGTPRIVVNPLTAQQSDQWVQATLTHEAVHVATDSACTAGTAWVVEGAAESVAAANDVETAQTNAKLVREYLRTQPRPRALPSAINTQTDYALAQLAIDQVRAKLGVRASAFIARGVAGELSSADVANATQWYVAALASSAKQR
jgi:hypothetical protein